MGNNLCDAVSKQKQIVHHIQANDRKIKYGFDPTKVVQHLFLQISSNEQVSKQLQPILQKLQESQHLYKDPDFQTLPLILKSESSMKKCTWVRPNQIIKQQLRIKTREKLNIIVRDQIMQYFGVFLMFLQRNPQLIQQIIQTQINSFGLYALFIFCQKKKQLIIIDDLFLFDQNKQQFAFSQPINSQIWPLIIQKAWIKQLKSITNLEYHQPHQPYKLFIDKPYSVLSIKQLSQSNIEQITNSKQFVIFESNLHSNIKIGLSGKKYIVVLCSFKINEQFFIVLRNPCGKFEFRGIWSDPTEGQIRKALELGYQLKEPGNFVIQESEWNQFHNIIIFNYIKNYYDTKIQFNVQNNKPIFIKIKVRDQAPIFFRIQQNQGIPSPLMIDFFAVPSFQQIPTNSLWGTQTLNLNQIKTSLKPGHYIIRIVPKESKSSQNKIYKSYLIAYSYNSIQFQQNIQYENQFNKYLLFLGKNSQSKIITKIDFSYQLTWFTNRVIIYIKNSYKGNRNIKLEFYFPNLKNLQILNEGKNSTTIEIKQEYAFVLEKIELNKETSIGEFSITSY